VIDPTELAAAPAGIRLADYRPPDFDVLGIDLSFDLDPEATFVTAQTRFRRRGTAVVPLRLHGGRFTVRSLKLDGIELPANAHTRHADGLEIHAPPAEFTFEAVTVLDPSANAALEGLYMSGGRFCTQCEAEGFRHITFALDRPDVMTRYRVRIEADAAKFPTLLGNGNCTSRGPLPEGRHYADWIDPWPKPTYLFALAAGAYETIERSFTTMSGKRVALSVHVDPGEGPRATFAMDSLVAAMQWDERVFRREYDLDEFHIVAVRDFNFGAMENKGLNIFNSAYVLADEETATDADFEGIESVVGHEYFHNWTGNRITCRDWFQLSLKEGLTVFRDQEFSADLRSRAVQRIKDVRRLRLRQFAEDAGPLAHAVRPASYRKIDNFYTATVYEKGAEVIRMLRTVVGDDAFARGMQLYFERRDGTASTVEDFVACFAESLGRDLGQFLRWYEQAGTPQLHVRGTFDAATRSYVLTVRQSTPATPGQSVKQPFVIPLRAGLLAADGTPMSVSCAGGPARTEHVLTMATDVATFRFTDVASAPIPTVLRGFTAPVRVDDGLSPAERLVQMAHDPDPFTRWDAGQSLAMATMLAAGGVQTAAVTPRELANALLRELRAAAADPAFAATALRLPELPELIQAATAPDPDRLADARDAVRRTIAAALHDDLVAVAAAPAPTAGARSLRAAALDLLAAQGPTDEPLLRRVFATATTMSETMASLEALGACGGDGFDEALERFHARFHDRPLVLDKWFAVQAAAPRSDAIERVKRLRAHPAFDLRTPNRVRAVVGAFAQRNLRAFHSTCGSGYAFVADVAREVDAQNPALAARLLLPFESWRRFDAARQERARRVLGELAAGALSSNTREVVERTLSAS